VIDAAHNRDSAKRLAQAINKRWPNLKFTTVLGISEGKDVEGIVIELLPVTASFILTNPAVRMKGSELPQLMRLLDEYELSYNVIEEIHEATALPTASPLLFTGSFFTALTGARLYAPSQKVTCEQKNK
jgi:folylpolyglutamate synthase/dihydropteroate synthase